MALDFVHDIPQWIDVKLHCAAEASAGSIIIC